MANSSKTVENKKYLSREDALQLIRVLPICVPRGGLMQAIFSDAIQELGEWNKKYINSRRGVLRQFAVENPDTGAIEYVKGTENYAMSKDNEAKAEEKLKEFNAKLATDLDLTRPTFLQLKNAYSDRFVVRKLIDLGWVTDLPSNWKELLFTDEETES